MANLSDDDIKRALLFIPAATQEHLHRWIQVYLDLDIPDSMVDPTSTCSPMGMIWQIYERALKNDDPHFNRVLYYASRDSFKTLCASIIEVLSVLHLNRPVAHMAAIEEQSKKAQSYVKKFFSRPYLRDFVEGDNLKSVEVVRFYNQKTGQSLFRGQFNGLPEAVKSDFSELRNYIKIIICTMQGANSEHVPLFVVDEVDVVKDPRAYEESALIPAPWHGNMPITLLTSTRKFSYGLVQKEIDNAEVSGLKIYHWNLLDVTQACPSTRHRPDLPRLPIYRSDDTLRALSEEQYKALDDQARSRYVLDEGYSGCLSNCRLFAVCQGRLATKQTSKSALLKPIDHTINQFRAVSIPTAKAQLLCWKPSTEGMIYPLLEREVHCLTPAQIAERVTGEPHRPNLTKGELVEILKNTEGHWIGGMDFGWTHNFAVVLAFSDGFRAYVIDVISKPELEPAQAVAVCDQRIKPFDPSIWPDPASPQMIAVFRRAGYRMRTWKKDQGSVLGGIEIVRMKLNPAVGEPQLYFLKGDAEVDLLVKHMSSYHWKTDATGLITKDPDETDDDGPDACRYMVMNFFAPKGKMKAAKPEAAVAGRLSTDPYSKENWLRTVLEEHGVEPANDVSLSKGRKGGFRWNI